MFLAPYFGSRFGPFWQPGSKLWWGPGVAGGARKGAGKGAGAEKTISHHELVPQFHLKRLNVTKDCLTNYKSCGVIENTARTIL